MLLSRHLGRFTYCWASHSADSRRSRSQYLRARVPCPVAPPPAAPTDSSALVSSHLFPPPVITPFSLQVLADECEDVYLLEDLLCEICLLFNEFLQHVWSHAEKIRVQSTRHIGRVNAVGFQCMSGVVKKRVPMGGRIVARKASTRRITR